MHNEPIKKFKSSIEGKNADVAVFVDRIEWSTTGRFIKSQSVEVIPLRSVSSVTSTKDGMVSYKVTVRTSGADISFRVPKVQADEMRQLILDLMLNGGSSIQPSPPMVQPPPPIAPQPPPPMPPAPPAVSVTDELVKLAALRDAGVLTDDEFATQKAKILA